MDSSQIVLPLPSLSPPLPRRDQHVRKQNPNDSESEYIYSTPVDSTGAVSSDSLFCLTGIGDENTIVSDFHVFKASGTLNLWTFSFNDFFPN